ncbi:MAG TPA: hypothetical protein PKV97_01840 [Thauera aminoaromatica]|nr:hypothetical protein [Thauera aminoaromatica]
MKTVFTIVYDAPELGPGPNADDTHTKRFTNKKQAETFAAGKTYYGQPVTVQEDNNVPPKLFQRWKREGKIG